jgi:hypothetical protein
MSPCRDGGSASGLRHVAKVLRADQRLHMLLRVLSYASQFTRGHGGRCHIAESDSIGQVALNVGVPTVERTLRHGQSTIEQTLGASHVVARHQQLHAAVLVRGESVSGRESPCGLPHDFRLHLAQDLTFRTVDTQICGCVRLTEPGGDAEPRLIALGDCLEVE